MFVYLSNKQCKKVSHTKINHDHIKKIIIIYTWLIFVLCPVRIDANVEDTQLNVEAAHTEILKYFQSVSSNRWLMIKIFLVLIIFFIIFVVFLAWGPLREMAKLKKKESGVVWVKKWTNGQIINMKGLWVMEEGRAEID